MDKFIYYKDIQGFYKDDGNGPIIMLLHGYCGDHRVWEPVMKSLTSKFRVIRPDLPGFGGSSLTMEPLTTKWMSEYVHAICMEENIEKVPLIGHSMGGYVALEFADKYPEMISGLGLVHSHCFSDSIEKRSKRKRALKFLENNNSDGFVKELYKTLFAPKFIDSFPEIVEAQIEKSFIYPKAALISGYQAMLNRRDTSHVLKNIACPVMFFSGKEDLSIDYELSLKQASIPNIADYYMLDNVGHMGMYESTDQLVHAIHQLIEVISTVYPPLSIS